LSPIPFPICKYSLVLPNSKMLSCFRAVVNKAVSFTSTQMFQKLCSYILVFFRSYNLGTYIATLLPAGKGTANTKTLRFGALRLQPRTSHFNAAKVCGRHPTVLPSAPRRLRTMSSESEDSHLIQIGSAVSQLGTRSAVPATVVFLSPLSAGAGRSHSHYVTAEVHLNLGGHRHILFI